MNIYLKEVKTGANIHVSIIHNSQMVQATQMSIERLTGKQNTVHINSGILVSLQKEENFEHALILMNIGDIMLSQEDE